jgi:hypothetical protein
MAKREKPRKVGRNDPCWCGSGKKYKECHVPIEEQQRSEQRTLEKAQDGLMQKIIEQAQTIPTVVPAAFELFWNGKYTMEQMDELDDLEDHGADRFLTWFAFDYVQEDGATLVAHLLSRAGDGDGGAGDGDGGDAVTFDELELRLLREWVGVRMRPYVIESVQKGQGFVVRDMLEQSVYDVQDHHASRRMEAGELIVGHILPVGVKDAGKPPAWALAGEPPPDSATAGPGGDPPIPLYVIGGAVAHLTADTADALLEYAALYREDLRRTHPDATWDDFIRQRSHVLNHFVMDLPVEHDPSALEETLSKTRVALQMTGYSLASMVGLGRSGQAEDDAKDDADDDAEDDADDKNP